MVEPARSEQPQTGDDTADAGEEPSAEGADVGAIMEAYSPGALKKARPVAVVMGEYEGDVDGQGMPVLLIGDCAKVKGEVKGKTRRIGGCPVVVPYFMNFGCYYFKTPNPYLDPSAFWKFPYYMAVSYINKLRNRTLG
ncbi:MAG: hypothetical protein R6V10_13665 [bacterium]